MSMTSGDLGSSRAAARNRHGQPVGPPVIDRRVELPRRDVIAGAFCELVPTDPAAHGPALHAAMAQRPDHDPLWTYMPFGPFDDLADMLPVLEQLAAWDEWCGYTILVDGEPRGWAAYLRPDLHARSIEVGGIVFSPGLQRTAAATESMYLMARTVFDAGFRRYEWKCDALNEASRRAALRLGFTYEGTFRQATIYKGRSRDTAWYSMIDTEWPDVEEAFVAWLDEGNFDDAGRQRRRLEKLRAL